MPSHDQHNGINGPATPAFKRPRTRLATRNCSPKNRGMQKLQLWLKEMGPNATSALAALLNVAQTTVTYWASYTKPGHGSRAGLHRATGIDPGDWDVSLEPAAPMTTPEPEPELLTPDAAAHAYPSSSADLIALLEQILDAQRVTCRALQALESYWRPAAVAAAHPAAPAEEGPANHALNGHSESTGESGRHAA